MCINHDPVTTLTDFIARSHSSHMQKTVKITLKEKNFQEMSKWTEYYEFEKEINHKGYSDSVLGL